MIYLEDVPNRFSLSVPSPGWLKPIEDYDGELRIFPSQKHPVFRLARLARRSGGYTRRLFSKLPGLHPDTKIMLERNLVAITTIPKEATIIAPDNVLRWLRDHDGWRAGGGKDDAAADRVVDLLEQQDVAREQAIDNRVREGLRDRVRPMRTSYLYRTGARVSLVKPSKTTDAMYVPSSPALGSSTPAKEA